MGGELRRDWSAGAGRGRGWRRGRALEEKGVCAAAAAAAATAAVVSV